MIKRSARLILLFALIFIPSTIYANKTVSVEIAPTQEEEKVESVNAIGTLLPYESIVIRPEVSGKIETIGFEEGQTVEKSQILITFDHRTQEAKVKNAQANFVNAKQIMERLKAAKGSSSAQQLDAAEANLLKAEAELEMAQVELDRMTIKAPFSGRIGLRNFDVGSYVQTGIDLVNLMNIDRLKLEFNLPEYLAHTIAVGQPVQFIVDNYPKKIFAGDVYALSPEIEKEGRSLVVRALYDNQDHVLLPGMFARISLRIPLGYNVIMIPEEALFSSEGKQFVYKVIQNENGELIAKLTEVMIGDRNSFSVEIIRGLEKGDIVVKAGQARISDGSLIKDVNQKRADTKS